MLTSMSSQTAQRARSKAAVTPTTGRPVLNWRVRERRGQGRRRRRGPRAASRRGRRSTVLSGRQSQSLEAAVLIPVGDRGLLGLDLDARAVQVVVDDLFAEGLAGDLARREEVTR